MNGETFDSHSNPQKIGEGANGVVYLADSDILKRKEVVKIWRAAAPNDTRDKKKQAFLEAAKLANANEKHAVQIYSAGLIGGVPFATMEFVNGKTLKETVGNATDKRLLLILASDYLTAIEETSQGQTFHGDPHWSNVLVYEHQLNKYETNIKLKLCDFGTSIFSNHENSVNRHWRLVEQCVLDTTKSLGLFQEAKAQLPHYKSIVSKMLAQPKPESIDDLSWAKMHTAPLHDYLSYLSQEFRRT